MAKSNYSFQKRQKELARKKKKEEKKLRKMEKKDVESIEPGDDPIESADDTEQP